MVDKSDELRKIKKNASCSPDRLLKLTCTFDWLRRALTLICNICYYPLGHKSYSVMLKIKLYYPCSDPLLYWALVMICWLVKFCCIQPAARTDRKASSLAELPAHMRSTLICCLHVCGTLLGRVRFYYHSQTNKLFQEYAGTGCSFINARWGWEISL